MRNLKFEHAGETRQALPQKGSFQDAELRDIVRIMSIIRWVVLAGLAIVLLVGMTRVCSLTPGGPGTTDFIQYWSAWQLMQQGANPYDTQLLAQIQASLTGKADFLIFSWNPPWTFLALSPILSLPFIQSASMWLALQIGLLLVVSLAAPRGLGKHVPSPLVCVVATILFFPILNSIKMGQLGVLFATSIALFLYLQRSGAFLLAGLSLLPLTFKPHLFFLFLVPGVSWLKQLSPQRRTQFLIGLLGGFGTLMLLCCTLWPSVFASWLHALTTKASTTTGPRAIHISDWQTATLATWLRLILLQQTGTLAAWPMLIIPVVSFTLCSLYFYRRNKPIRWETVAPPLLCLSLGTSNYGWVFDQSVLIVCQIALVCACYDLHDRGRIARLITLLITIQLVAIIGSNVLDLPQHYYAWVPWVYLALFWTFARSSRSTDHQHSTEAVPEKNGSS